MHKDLKIKLWRYSFDTYAFTIRRSRLRRKGLREELLRKPSLPHRINAGIYLFKPEIFDHLPDKGDLEETALQKMAEDRRLKAVWYKGYGFWRSIDTHKDIEEVESLLTKEGSGLHTVKGGSSACPTC
jgi:NDP-sugar pyrophosphorylase family protein